MAACLFAPLAAWAQAQPSACNGVAAYSPCEIVFGLSPADAAAHPNPYGTVDLAVQFRSPDLHAYALPGYWDGGSRMVVRFSPVSAGEWVYRVISNVPAWNGQEGSFTAKASNSPGFVHPAEVHHWAYTERDQAHLWMGATEMRFAALDDASFRAMADARAAARLNHVRGLALGESPEQAFPGGRPDAAYFERLDQRVRYFNQEGIIADLILGARPSELARLFPAKDDRRRFARYMAARYAAMNITWQVVAEFEGDYGGRALLKEIGLALKEADGYQHPRTSGARITSAPLLDDGWMDFAAYGPGADDSVGAIEHQLYGAPAVNFDTGAGAADADAFRHRLWNTAMDGEYPASANGGGGADAANAKAMTAWFNFFSGTRHWELEPYFDVDGGRALALEDAEYIVYMEKPGALDVQVENRSYDVFWMNPATGEIVKEKKSFEGYRFTGAPPDKSHDWVLHLVRPGRLASLARDYKFESRNSEEDSRALPIVLQEVELDPAKAPFETGQIPESISLHIPAPYAIKVTKDTKAARSMMWLWTGEVAAGGQGYRVLATAPSGTLEPPRDTVGDLPADLLLRLYGMNAYGKVYLVTKACQLTP